MLILRDRGPSCDLLARRAIERLSFQRRSILGARKARTQRSAVAAQTRRETSAGHYIPVQVE